MWDFRNLKSYNGLTFKYNASGLRTKKVNGDKKTDYTWVGNKLLSEKRHIEHSDLQVGDYIYVGEVYYTTLEKIKIDYMYGISGITGFTLTNFMGTKNYYFQKNILGDVEKIYNEHNELVAEYTYDAWGNCTILKNVNNIATLNAIRYRSYYWDEDLKMYYLQSRWYDAEVGRFINADNIEILNTAKDHSNGSNLYAYCFNRPTMMTDETGNWPQWLKWLATAVVVVVAVAAVVLVTVATAGIGTAIGGALGGGVAATIFGGAVGGAITGALTGAIIGGGISIVSQGLTVGYENINWGKVGMETLIGAGTGALSGAVLGGAGKALGLLGKTSWAQRVIPNLKNSKAAFMFGSKSGSFTFARFGTGNGIFRLEASLAHGLHFHMARRTAYTSLINILWNSSAVSGSYAIRN